MKYETIYQDGSSFLLINDIISAQTPGVVDVFKRVIKDFDTIIEIGTNRGGFTLLLDDIKRPDASLISYEKFPEVVLISDKEIDLRFGCCFELKDHIAREIKNGGRVLFLCDGGYKNQEFIEFSSHLKKGDVIMLHDYQDNPDDFSRICKINNWAAGSESSYDSIKDIVSSLNMNRYYYNEFKDVFWGAFIR